MGEAVVAILAKSKNALEDLIDEVVVEYEALPAVITIEEAKGSEAILFDGWENNISSSSEVKRGNAQSAITSAPFVVSTRIGIARQAGTPIEPRATVAIYDTKADMYEVHATVQSVQRLRTQLSAELGLPEEKFRVRVMDVGGGFGTKGAQSNPEHVLACIFSKATGRPVRWTSTRTEDLLETAAGRDEYCELTLACDSNGRILALRANIDSDVGVSGSLSVMSGLTLRLLPGAYKIPNLELKATAYVTNKAPLGPVRG
ncbi:MAG: molybdopterin-dependent oxidoreductase, partial [Nitrososphaerota archaeon]|nr:molybdopterin-dependent oxidoreductase [Nitrososphaerota archaeon]